MTGGSDPKNFLGGWKPKKWGRSRPFQSFSTVTFTAIGFPISLAAKKFLLSQCDETGEGERGGCNPYLLHPSAPGPRSGAPNRRSIYVLKCALTERLVTPNS